MININENRTLLSYGAIAVLIIIIGFVQSWSVALSMINICIISAIMALGVNIQWGYAGIFNVGIMGFAALGGLSVVLVSKEKISAAINAGGLDVLIALFIFLTSIGISIFAQKKFNNKLLSLALVLIGFFSARFFYASGTQAIEAVNPAVSGYLGGLGLPLIFSWIIAALFGALVAFLIGKITLGLRADYLAIATLGISEIIISLIKNETWLTRGVNNVTGIPRPVPYEIDLQNSPWFIDMVTSFYSSSLAGLNTISYQIALNNYITDASVIIVKLLYVLIFALILILLIVMANLALNSPWGRMIRAIRDNEVAASAMGKNVKFRHMQIFIIGSAIVALGGALLVTYDGQFTPGSYSPLRYTFLIWVMVIVGGSGNNHGAVIGAFVIWFIWVQADPIGFYLVNALTVFLDDGNFYKTYFLENSQYMRYILMGFILLLVMRFKPHGILPENKFDKQ